MGGTPASQARVARAEDAHLVKPCRSVMCSAQRMRAVIRMLRTRFSIAALGMWFRRSF